MMVRKDLSLEPLMMPPKLLLGTWLSLTMLEPSKVIGMVQAKDLPKDTSPIKVETFGALKTHDIISKLHYHHVLSFLLR